MFVNDNNTTGQVDHCKNKKYTNGLVKVKLSIQKKVGLPLFVIVK